ncbi:putative DsbA family dithiol-disulfide isomerase [Paenibacillus endophyticus]|uniref:Putative DsbA family dithiol-disulfide isomerase n=1 Tax=Paenibacillus endophyticus TaxID=1294268 RepID=A0A7W5CEP9_9BACL|nr:DsbA family oxidoreductase [Paenibacillus endophyticus]MBB3156301.1 putative DsbA family dithiol-disulfide isomerase [Paenibacillus endophyticus]
MIVEMWSDIICPSCYIVKRRFEAGLQAFAHRDQIKIVYRSFQLDPTFPVHPNTHLLEIAAARHRTNVEKMARKSRVVAETAKQEGLLFNYENVKYTNTLDAHRLVHFAKQFGKEGAVLDLLYKAYFTDCKHIGELETLVSLAVQAGLERQKTMDMLLDTKRYKNAVRLEQLVAERLGVRAVPFFLINDCHAISGAHPVATFIQALETSWEEEERASQEDESYLQ